MLPFILLPALLPSEGSFYHSPPTHTQHQQHLQGQASAEERRAGVSFARQASGAASAMTAAAGRTYRVPLPAASTAAGAAGGAGGGGRTGSGAGTRLSNLNTMKAAAAVDQDGSTQVIKAHISTVAKTPRQVRV
jgi:hypothetical protein